MNDFCLQPGQGLKARLGGTPLPKLPLSSSQNRGSQWGGSFDDCRLIFTNFDGRRSNFEIINK